MECGLWSLSREMFIQKVHRLLVHTLVLSDLHSNHIPLATCSLVTAFYELDLQTPDTSSSKSHVLLLISLSLSFLSLVHCSGIFKRYILSWGLGHWLRHCATSRAVPGSIPGGVTRDFFRGYRRNHVPWGRLSL
jgi:hypothetical protein